MPLPGRIEAIADELALKIKVAASTGAPKLILTVTTERRKGTRALCRAGVFRRA